MLSSFVPSGSNDLIASVTMPEAEMMLPMMAALGLGLFVICAVTADWMAACAVFGRLVNLPPVISSTLPSTAPVAAPTPPEINALTGS